MDLFKLKVFTELVEYAQENKDAKLALLLSILADKANPIKEPSINNGILFNTFTIIKRWFKLTKL